MTKQFQSGFIHGTGAAINVEIGFLPDIVKIYNWDDGDLITIGFCAKVIAFTSGGTTEIKAGDTIRGLTNTNVHAKVRQVILDSGSWAGGDAAGWFIFDAVDMTGTFGSENAEVNDSGSNDVTVAAQVEKGIAVAAAAASATGNAAVIGYVGAEATNAMGFTLGSTVSENGKLLYFEASRGDTAIDQTTVW